MENDCDKCEHKNDSSTEYCGTCGGGVESNWKEAGWLKDEKIDRLESELREWKQKYKKLNTELMCELRDPCGTIWEHAKMLQDKSDALEKKLDDAEKKLDAAKEALNVIKAKSLFGDSINGCEYDNRGKIALEALKRLEE